MKNVVVEVTNDDLHFLSQLRGQRSFIRRRILNYIRHNIELLPNDYAKQKILRGYGSDLWDNHLISVCKKIIENKQ